MSDSPMQPPATIPELIDAFGGPAAFGRVIGKGASTASEQKRSGRLGVEYWDVVIAAAPGAGVSGVTYELLVRMHTSADRRIAATEART